MEKRWMFVGLVGIALGLNGCGGSSKGIAEGASSGSLSVGAYRATLPDGTPMVIDFVSQSNGVYSGGFALAANDGEYARQSGSFVATLEGSRLTAECASADGKGFQMTGTVDSRGMRLTRSDVATTLAFSQIPDAAQGRSEISFFFDGLAGSKGRVVLNGTPNSVTTAGSTTIREYKGSWLGVPVVFWSYSSGTGNILVYNDPLCVTSASYASFQPSDFGTKSATASTGYMTMYNSTLRTQLKFKTLPTVSP